MQEPPNGDPTPEQIRELCREIREGWSEKEYWVRSGHVGGKPVMTVPMVRDRGRVAAT